MESKIDRAKKLLDEWLVAEEAIDKQRKEVITDLQKKIAEIQRDRMAIRAKIADSIQLFNRFSNATKS